MNIIEIILWFVITPLLVTYLANYTYPKLESFVKNRNLSSRERKIKSLIHEYKVMKDYRKDAPLLIMVAIRGIAFALLAAIVGLSVAIVTVPFLVLVGLDESLYSLVPLPFNMVYQILPNQIYSIFVLLFASALLIFESVFALYRYAIYPINTVLSIDTFREKTIAKLKKLGGNPEDLDKEETIVPVKPERFYGGGEG